ncbi:Glu/Leu/Phe/Val dehydrogenase dimerization domain-containing protein [Bradyrhizobium sp. CW7]|uniref:Glu/Leu/Phe/Val dehydrogenase dimerization domain-containing protein n=1 Tax=Bradyrhizobium sp. CW7 TaxID=2782688 RepID=UPI001FFB1DF4|nr:Glu/Leu/Phe/Val dehydrogenase dimerization domain-containing protein [Bradyrhizobium sp. CW7]
MISFVGPHTDVMAPDMGANEQVVAWFMDTYSMYQGQTINEIATGEQVSAGRILVVAKRPVRAGPIWSAGPLTTLGSVLAGRQRLSTGWLTSAQ